MKKISIFIILLITISTMACKFSSNTKSKKLAFNWSIAGKIPDSSIGLAGPVAGISNGVLIVGGGSNFPNDKPWNGGEKKYYNELFIFDKQEDTLLPLPKRNFLSYKVAYSANCSTEKGMVIAGGQNTNGALSQVRLLHWDSKAQKLLIDKLPDLPQPLSSGAIASVGHDIFFAGGQNAEMVSDQLYHFNLNRPEKGWNSIAKLPHSITHAVLYAAGKRLYLIGGRKRNPDSTSTLFDAVFQYNLQNHEWTQKTALPYALSAHTGVAWNDSTLLVFSGDKGKTFHQTENLIMKIAKEEDSTKKERLIQQKKELQESHPGFSGDVLAYHIQTNEWEKIDTIPFPGQVTTTAIKWGNKIVIPCGEIRAGVRTPEIVLGSKQ